jgi:hypothetical protein
MSADLYESMVQSLEQRASEEVVKSFALDDVLALCLGMRAERLELVGKLVSPKVALSPVDMATLACFDVVAVAVKRAFSEQGGAAAGYGDPVAILTGLWGTARAGRALWGNHFIFESSTPVEGREAAIRESARLVGSEALAFSVKIGQIAPQFSEFVAKDILVG